VTTGRAQPRAIIVGGSLAGLFTALLLRQVGWRVDVYERVSVDLSARRAGIVTHDELWRVLECVGIRCEPRKVGVEVSGRTVLDSKGAVAGELAHPQVLMSWGRLYSLLRAALPNGEYHAGKSLTALEQDRAAVTARFADGSTECAELLVAADGIHSMVRSLIFPAAKPVYAGYFAWRGLVEEQALSAGVRQVLGDRFGFCLPPGEQMLGYPVAGAGEELRAGRRRYNFVWYRPAGETELARLLTDIDGIRHELSIPPNRIRSDVVSELRQDAERLLAPQFAEVVARTEQPFIQAIFDLESQHMARGRVVLLGDAPFVARPHVGMGVTKAAGDAAALAHAISLTPNDIVAALARFEAARRPRGMAVLR